MPGPFDHPQRAAFAAHSWLIPRLLSRFKDPLVARQGHTGWTTRSAGRVRNGRFLAQGRRSASSLRTPRGLTTPARIRSIPLCGNVDAAGIRMPLHRFAGTIRRNKHRDDRAHGRLQNPLAQNDVRAGEPSRRWEARCDATSWKSSNRYQNAAILITSQLPVDKWHDVIGEPTFADAILDRIVHNAHRINLDGPSMRKTIAENFNANDVDHAERK